MVPGEVGDVTEGSLRKEVRTGIRRVSEGHRVPGRGDVQRPWVRKERTFKPAAFGAVLVGKATQDEVGARPRWPGEGL